MPTRKIGERLLELSAFAVAAAMAVLIQVRIGPIWLSGAAFAVATGGLTALLVQGWRKRRRALRVYAVSDDAPTGDLGPHPSGARSEFEELVLRGLEQLPPELRERMSNVEIVVEDEPPEGRPWLGLYQGVPLTHRGASYAWARPDKITIYRGPLERLYGQDPALLAAEVKHTVLHEVAHHFGISDERLVEIDRY